MSEKKKESKYNKVLGHPMSWALVGLLGVNLIILVGISTVSNEHDKEGWHDMKPEVRAAVINGMANMYVGLCIASAGAFVAAGAAQGRIKEEEEE